MTNQTDSRPEDTFYLGLTMAGAVSAGCYTAGAMDYLIEILDLWDRMKAGEFPEIDPDLIPTHKVVIDAMGGASAGGMATIMTAIYALEGKVNPVQREGYDARKNYNILHDSWVHLCDDTQPSFAKLWNTTDLDRDKKIYSLLNTDVIDEIAHRAFSFPEGRNLGDQIRQMKPYFSKNLEVLLSHTMLRGIPLDVDLSTASAPKGQDIAKHTTFEHYMVSHFKFDTDTNSDSKGYLELDPYSDIPYAPGNPSSLSAKKRMILSTIATGAFPLGLKYRGMPQEQFPDIYLKSVIKRIVCGNFGLDDPDVKNKIDFNSFPAKFCSLTIDGGAINNEPYREVLSILKARHENGSAKKMYGFVMIDPFPDRPADGYTEPEDLIDVAPLIIKTLWNQSKVKRKEMLEEFRGEYRGQIYPSRYEKGEKLDYPLTSAAFEAFGGFLDVRFRSHDFFLGRDNARNFYRYFFSIPYYGRDSEHTHPIHRSAFWTDKAVEKFLIRKIDDHGVEQCYLPIIPDMSLVLHNKSVDTDRENYSMERPVFDPEVLLNLDGNIAARVRKLLHMIKERKPGKGLPVKVETPDEVTNKWMEKYYRESRLRKTWNATTRFFVLSFVYPPARNHASQTVSRTLIKMILLDLEKRGLLKNPSDR